MKKLLIIAAVSMASASAFASKARLNALQNAAHLSDIQDVVGHSGAPVKPDEALNFGDSVTVEFGSTSGATTNAEAGFIRKSGEGSAWGAYLGNKADTWSYFYALDNASFGNANAVNQANPLDLFYASKAGDMQWGAGLHYVSNDFKANKFKENIMSLYLSATSAMGWDVQLGLGLGAEATDSTVAATEKKLKGGSSVGLSGRYKMDTLYVFGSYKSAAAKFTTGTTDTTDRSKQTITLGVVESMKKDATEFFYGASYVMDTAEQKVGTTSKVESTSLPVIAGVEVDAASWMTLRGSVTQNVLLGSSKTTTGGTAGDASAIGDNTTVAAGVGLKWGKATVDATIASANKNGAAFGTDAGNFLSQLGLTYAW